MYYSWGFPVRGRWTIFYFEADEAEADRLARALADALDKPGWYVDFRSPRETFVVFPGVPVDLQPPPHHPGRTLRVRLAHT